MKEVVLITGGSDGLGLEISKKLCGEFTVVALSNKKESLDNLKTKIDCETEFCDVTDPTHIEQILNIIVEKYGRIDYLINNAGVWVGGELTQNTYDQISAVIAINVVGTINMTKAVLPHFIKNKSGKVINIISTNGIETKPERSVYCASKWAITGFTGSLRKELQKYGISVIGINPGLMRTNLHTTAGAERDMTNAMEVSEVANIVEFVLKQKNITIEQITFRSIEAEIF